MQVYMSMHAQMYVHMYVHTNAHVHAPVPVSTYIYACLLVPICICTCICTCTVHVCVGVLGAQAIQVWCSEALADWGLRFEASFIKGASSEGFEKCRTEGVSESFG